MVSVWDYLKLAGSIVAVGFIFMMITTTLHNSPTGYAAAPYKFHGTCEDSCGSPTLTPGGNCFCDRECYSKGDCCPDIKRYCS